MSIFNFLHQYISNWYHKHYLKIYNGCSCILIDYLINVFKECIEVCTIIDIQNSDNDQSYCLARSYGHYPACWPLLKSSSKDVSCYILCFGLYIYMYTVKICLDMAVVL